MSIGPTSFVGSVAGTPLSQAKGAELERAQHDAASQERQVAGDRQAENAAGVGSTEEESATGDRDADGHRLWEKPPEKLADNGDATADEHRVKDPTGQSGSLLDLSG
ncbi:MAG TPA: hypothetical protein VFW87_03910 [Pirellulales bacterium]|nr:hypothetical protein [Pirellulales bacterium]